MKTTPTELGFERLLKALEQELLGASDEEIEAVANELGIKPGMKGSIALFGVTRAVRSKTQDNSIKLAGGTKDQEGKPRLRRRPRGNTPSSR